MVLLILVLGARAKDTTKGPAQPLGERGAVKADTLAGDDDANTSARR